MMDLNGGKSSNYGGVLEPKITTEGQNANVHDSRAIPKAGGLSYLKSMYKTASSLNSDGVRFKDDLILKLKESTFEGTSLPVMLREPVSTHIPPVGEVLYLTGDNDNTFVVIFKNGFNTTYEPPTEHLGKIVDKLTEYHDGACEVFNVLIVDSDSYNRLESIYMYIFNNFVYTRKDAVRLNLSHISARFDFKDKTIILDTNIHSVRMAMDAMSTVTSVQPRVDYGVVVKVAEKSQKYGQSDDIDNAETIAVIGAFTDFIQQSQPTYGKPSIMPVITISAIESLFQQRELLAMYIPIAVQEFLNQELWLSPYMKFTNSDVSLGDFVDDPNHVVQNPNDVQMIAQKILAKPELAIEVSLGRPMLPGLLDLVYNESAFYKDLSAFIGDKEADPRNICARKVTEYTGVLLTQGEEPMDTKHVDYLSLAKSMKNEDTLQLLYRFEDPRERVNLLRKIYGDDAIDIRYSSFICILDPVIVKNLGKLVLPELGITTIGGTKHNQLSFTGLGCGSYDTHIPSGGGNTNIRRGPFNYNFNR